MDHAGDERYVHAVGPLPLVTDPSTWGPAWAREEARPGIAGCAAHEVFRGVDPQNSANPFSKQIQAMPHARLPSLDDQCRSITVVRRGREVMYRRAYDDFLAEEPTTTPTRPTADFLFMSPPFIRATDGEEPTTTQLTTARAARLGTYGHLVAWHQAEYSTCPAAIRARFYLLTPAWWPSVEVPYGCMAKLP